MSLKYIRPPILINIRSICIIRALFQYDNIFGTDASMAFHGPQLTNVDMLLKK